MLLRRTPLRFRWARRHVSTRSARAPGAQVASPHSPGEVIGTTRPIPRYWLRLAAPLLLTLLAFPQFDVRAVRQLDPVSEVVAGLLAVGAILWMAGRAAPAATEPDVHDRQVDAILGLPLLAASIWCERGWSLTDPAHAPVTGHQVVAVVLFLAGATILLLGTRVAARWRWAIASPLVLLPWFDQHRTVQLGVVVLLLVAAVATQLRRRPRPAGTAHGSGQRLPRPAMALLAVAAMAVLMGGTVLLAMHRSGGDATGVAPAVSHANGANR